MNINLDLDMQPVPGKVIAINKPITQEKTHAQNKSLMMYNILSYQGFYMVNEGEGRLFRRKDGKYLICVPKDLAEDTMFTFKGSDSILVKIHFKIGDDKLTVEKWKDENHELRDFLAILASRPQREKRGELRGTSAHK